MLTSAFLANNGVLKVHVYTLPEKWRNLKISYILEHCFRGTIFRVMVFKKIGEVRKLERHFNCFVSAFLRRNCIFSTFH